MPTQKFTRIQAELVEEPVSLVGVLEAQNANLRKLLADLTIRTAILRRQVAEGESRQSAVVVALVPQEIRRRRWVI